MMSRGKKKSFLIHSEDEQGHVRDVHVHAADLEGAMDKIINDGPPIRREKTTNEEVEKSCQA